MMVNEMGGGGMESKLVTIRTVPGRFVATILDGPDVARVVDGLWDPAQLSRELGRLAARAVAGRPTSIGLAAAQVSRSVEPVVVLRVGALDR